MDFLIELQPWHWLILTFLLLGLEALGASGFLLGSAIASSLLALLLWLGPELSWAWQVAIFAFLSLVCSLGYWKVFRRVNNQSDYPELNNRAAQLVGRVQQLDQDLPAGQGKIQVGDTLWKVRADEPLSQGDHVEIVAYEGMTLILRKQ